MSLGFRKWRPRGRVERSSKTGDDGDGVRSNGGFRPYDADRLGDAVLDELTAHARGELQALYGEYQHFAHLSSRGDMRERGAEGKVRVRRDVEALRKVFGERLTVGVGFDRGLDEIDRDVEEELRPRAKSESESGTVEPAAVARRSGGRPKRKLVPEPEGAERPREGEERDDSDSGGLDREVADDLGEPLTPWLRRELIAVRVATTVRSGRGGIVSADGNGVSVEPRLTQAPVSRPAPALKPDPEPEEEGEDLPPEALLTDDDFTIAELSTMLLRHGAADDSDLDVYAEILGGAEGPVWGLILKRYSWLGNTRAVGTLRKFIYNLWILFENATGRRDFDSAACLQAMSMLSAKAKECDINSERIFRGRKSGVGRGPRTTVDVGDADRSDADSSAAADDAQFAYFNMLRVMLRKSDFWRLWSIAIKRSLAEDMAAEEADAKTKGRESRARMMEQSVKGLYADLLKRLSVKLHPRTRGKTSEILHPQVIVSVDGLAAAIDKGELPSGLFKQQTQGLEAIRRGFEHDDRCIYVDIPPGTGKTLILELAAQYLNPNGNSVLLVPNLNLVEQHRRQAKQHGVKLGVGIVSPHDAVIDQPLTIMTYQQMQGYIRRGLFRPDRFNLLLLDEVHETLRESRQGVLSAFPNAKVVGATATGQDSIGKDVSEMFRCVYHIDLADGWRAGICNPVILHNIDLPEYDTGDSSAVERDLIEREKAIEKWYRQNCFGDQVLILMSSNERAEAVAKYFRDQAIVKEAWAMHGKLPRTEIFSLNERFQDGQIKVLVTAEYIVQGWDCSGLRNLVLGDPPEQGWQAAQRIGRAIRRVTPTEKDSQVLQLRGGVVERLFPGRGFKLVKGERLTALDRLFRLPADFKSGSRIVEPQKGFWPRSPFMVKRAA